MLATDVIRPASRPFLTPASRSDARMARKLVASSSPAFSPRRPISAGPVVSSAKAAPVVALADEGAALSLRARMSDDTMHDDLLEEVGRLQWFALYATAQKEFVAQKILRRYGLKTFIPVRCEWRRLNRFSPEKTLVKSAAVPRYVFVGFEPGRPLWFDVTALPVVAGVVGIRGEPMRISPADMRTYVRKMGSGSNAVETRENMRVRAPVSVGGTARVLDGPFTGWSVPIISIAGDRAKARLTLFGGAVDEIELPLDSLAPA